METITTTGTRTPTEATAAGAAGPHAAAAASGARVVATAGRHGTALAELRPAAPWAPRPLLPNGAVARVALVQTTATLVAGDDVALDVEVGANASLELVETGATVAHDARGGPAAHVRIRVTLGPGARLHWLARPLVLAAGCHVERSCEVALACGARALLRETLVLGRAGEQPGTLRSILRATHAGRPLLHERLDTGDPALLRSAVVAGDAAVLDALYLLGARGAGADGATQLHGPGTAWRALTSRRHDPDAGGAPVTRAWAGELGPAGAGVCQPA